MACGNNNLIKLMIVIERNVRLKQSSKTRKISDNYWDRVLYFITLKNKKKQCFRW